MKSFTTVVLLTVTLVSFQLAETSFAGSLSNRWVLEFNAGAWSTGNDVYYRPSLTDFAVQYDATTFGGGLAFGRWFSEGFALLFTVEGRAFGGELAAGLTGYSTERDIIGWSALEARYNPFSSTRTGQVRPYLAAAVGPVVGHQGKTTFGFQTVAESTTETALGGEFTVGAAILLGDYVIIGGEIGAFGMTDFGQPIGGRNNYGGVKFGLDFGFIFGGSGP